MVYELWKQWTEFYHSILWKRETCWNSDIGQVTTQKKLFPNIAFSTNLSGQKSQFLDWFIFHTSENELSNYYEKTSNVRVNNELSDYTDLKRGVRQGCIASPDLFSLYTEMIMRHSDDEPGVNMGGHNINNIRFADDTGLIAGSQEDLQNLLNVIYERSEKFGMKINTAKTEVRIMNNWDKEKAEIMLNGVTLKQVEKFKYLGSWITSDGSCSTDIKCRIAEAKTAFTEMRSILSNLKMPFKLRYRILNCYVIPIMMYGCENWILMKSDIKKLEAAEMWFLRRMQKISWKEKKSNEEIVKSTIGSRNLLAKVMQRQTSFFGHIMRKQGIEQVVTTTCKIDGKRKRGRRPTQFLDQIMRWTNSQSVADVMNRVRSRTLTVVKVFWHGTSRRRWENF